jgi:hypothetical protein
LFGLCVEVVPGVTQAFFRKSRDEENEIEVRIILYFLIELTIEQKRATPPFREEYSRNVPEFEVADWNPHEETS